MAGKSEGVVCCVLCVVCCVLYDVCIVCCVLYAVCIVCCMLCVVCCVLCVVCCVLCVVYVHALYNKVSLALWLRLEERGTQRRRCCCGRAQPEVPTWATLVWGWFHEQDLAVPLSRYAASVTCGRAHIQAGIRDACAFLGDVFMSGFRVWKVVLGREVGVGSRITLPEWFGRVLSLFSQSVCSIYPSTCMCVSLSLCVSTCADTHSLVLADTSGQTCNSPRRYILGP